MNIVVAHNMVALGDFILYRQILKSFYYFIYCAKFLQLLNMKVCISVSQKNNDKIDIIIEKYNIFNIYYYLSN